MLKRRIRDSYWMSSMALKRKYRIPFVKMGRRERTRVRPMKIIRSSLNVEEEDEEGVEGEEGWQ